MIALTAVLHCLFNRQLKPSMNWFLSHVHIHSFMNATCDDMAIPCVLHLFMTLRCSIKTVRPNFSPQIAPSFCFSVTKSLQQGPQLQKGYEFKSLCLGNVESYNSWLFQNCIRPQSNHMITDDLV